ncbi:unnamed protein product [Calicophoron daubneyi]|uniref:G-protein coupled receptors family 1 profile domain-containing protein n=1 Tax=Calicophoron daubneyi TaxID=300641 RepID=A0AAV2TJD9_CALDB
MLPNFMLLITVIFFEPFIAVVHSEISNTSDNFSTAPVSDNRSSLLIEVAYPTWEDFAIRFMPAAFYADRYVTLVYYVVGFPGNLISLLVWTSRTMYRGNSAAVYLAGLSINDIIVLIFALDRDLSRSWHVRTPLFPGACEVKNTLTPAVQYASPLFVLGFTIERWLAICKPFAIDRICSTKRAIYICSMISVGTILLCSGNAYIFYTETYTCNKRVVRSTACDVYLSLLEAIFSGVVPVLALFFNCLVIKELAKIHRANKQLASISDRLTSSKKERERSAGGGRRRPRKLEGSYSYQPVKRTSIPRSHLDQTHYDENAPAPVSKTNHLPDKGKEGMGQPQVRPLGQRPHRRAQVSKSCTVEPTECDLSMETRHSPSFRSTTFMLLIVSFYMIITTLLGGLMYLLHQTQALPNLDVTEEELLADHTWSHYISVMTVKAFVDELALSYYAFGCIIYYATGNSFRHRVHQMMRRLLDHFGCRCRGLKKFGVSDDLTFTKTSRPRQRRSGPGARGNLGVDRDSTTPMIGPHSGSLCLQSRPKEESLPSSNSMGSRQPSVPRRESSMTSVTTADDDKCARTGSLLNGSQQILEVSERVLQSKSTDKLENLPTNSFKAKDLFIRPDYAHLDLPHMDSID